MFSRLLELTFIKEEDSEAQLSPREIELLQNKFDTAEAHLEALRAIFQQLTAGELALTRAHKLQHIGHKAQLDMSYFNDVRRRLEQLEDVVMDMHKVWMTSVTPHDE